MINRKYAGEETVRAIANKSKELLAEKSNINHSHDELYYTETEIDKMIDDIHDELDSKAGKTLVVTATMNADGTSGTTDYTSAEIIEHINAGGETRLLLNDTFVPYMFAEDGSVFYGVTIVSVDGIEVYTTLFAVSVNDVVVINCNYDPAKAGFATAGNVYTKTEIDEKVVDLTEAVENFAVGGHVWYGKTDTAGDVVQKAVTTTTGDFVLTAGAVLFVEFANTHTASTMSLKIDNGSSGAAFSADYTALKPNIIQRGEMACFVYNGNAFIMVRSQVATTSNYGVTKLNAAINSTSQGEAATPSAVKQAYDLANTANATATEAITLVDGVQERLDTKAPILLSVMSDYGDDGTIVTNYSAIEIITHLQNGGNTTLNDVDLGLFVYSSHTNGVVRYVQKQKIYGANITITAMVENSTATFEYSADATLIVNTTLGEDDTFTTDISSDIIGRIVSWGANSILKIGDGTYLPLLAVDSGGVMYAFTMVDNGVHTIVAQVSDTSGTISSFQLPTVTSAADGLMSSADKTMLDTMHVKLDGIEEGAIARHVWYGVDQAPASANGRLVETTTGDFSAEDGAIIFIKFQEGYMADMADIIVDNRTQGHVFTANHGELTANMIHAEEVVPFIYIDGEFIMARSSAATETGYGVVKLSSATNSTATDTAATSSAVNDVRNTAENAMTEATNAQTAADEAKTEASDARVVAEHADSTANDALNLANGLEADVNTAMRTASDASSVANSASTTANSAKTTANAALPKEGGTMTGALILAADPTNDLEATTKQYADDLKNVWFGTTSTSGATAAKTVTTISGDFKLEAGNIIYIMFNSMHTASSMQLNIDGTGAKSATYLFNGSTSMITSGRVGAKEIVGFVYNDGYFTMIEGATASTSAYGVTKLSSSTSSTSTALAATSSAVKSAYDKASAALPMAGGTMTGTLTLAADPVNALEAATKQYVDNLIGDVETAMTEINTILGGS